MAALGMCSYSPMVRRYMHVMLVQKHQKLLFLVDCKQLQYPLVTAVAATAYNTGIQLGTLPRWGRSCWKIRGGLNDPDFVFEQRDGQWIVNIGTWHTQMQGCPMCLLGKVLGGMPMA